MARKKSNEGAESVGDLHQLRVNLLSRQEELQQLERALAGVENDRAVLEAGRLPLAAAVYVDDNTAAHEQLDRANTAILVAEDEAAGYTFRIQQLRGEIADLHERISAAEREERIADIENLRGKRDAAIARLLNAIQADGDVLAECGTFHQQGNEIARELGLPEEKWRMVVRPLEQALNWHLLQARRKRGCDLLFARDADTLAVRVGQEVAAAEA